MHCKDTILRTQNNWPYSKFIPNSGKEVISMVEKRYGEKVFQTKIRENIAIAEMPLSGQTIFEYEPKSNGAADYQTLTDEIISREENR